MLSREQKRAVAMLVIRGAADAAAAFEEQRESFPEEDVLADVSYEEITAQVARWLRVLPGSGWDSRLPL